jgi:hypothetical protein
MCEVFRRVFLARIFQSRKNLNLSSVDAVMSCKPMVSDDHGGLEITLQHPMNAFYYGHSPLFQGKNLE